jgi:hypothetical protein
MLVGLIMSILTPPSGVLVWIDIVLCGLCNFFDMLLLFFLLMPRITRNTKLLAFGLSVLCGLAVSLLTSFVQRDEECVFCSQHYPVPAVGWIYLVQGLFLIVCCFLAKFRPFSYSPRPATIIYSIFWIPIYLVCGVVLPIMHANYSNGATIDWGFCVLGIAVVFYYVMLVPVLYLTVSRDSAYVLRHGLDEGTARSEPHQLEADARYLLARHDNTELVGLLGDASLSLIKADELHLVRRVGCGGFGEVYQVRQKKMFQT